MGSVTISGCKNLGDTPGVLYYINYLYCRRQNDRKNKPDTNPQNIQFSPPCSRNPRRCLSTYTSSTTLTGGVIFPLLLLFRVTDDCVLYSTKFLLRKGGLLVDHTSGGIFFFCKIL